MRNQTDTYINKCPIFSHAVGRKGCTKQKGSSADRTWVWTSVVAKIKKNKIKHNPEVNNQEILCLDISTCPQSIAYSSPFPFQFARSILGA